MTAERSLPLGDPLVSATLTLRTALRRAPSGIAVLRAPIERALAYLEAAVRARAAAQYHDLIARRDGPPGDGTAAAELFPSGPGVPSAAAVPLATNKTGETP